MPHEVERDTVSCEQQYNRQNQDCRVTETPAEVNPDSVLLTQATFAHSLAGLPQGRTARC
jgi:hypothetical protein